LLKNKNMDVPILFIVFNRPESTQLIFDKIRSLKPTTLYISSDGPRVGNETDVANISKVRSVFEGVDWDCKVHTLYREENLGCGRGPSEGIKWFFSEVEYGIVLEDDCLPTTSFFGFCEQMLKKYKHDKSVFHISGNNWYPESDEIKEDYYFTNHAGMWGWASWADRWSKYDFRLTNNIPQVREKVKTQFQ
jgi:GT2 family glycosyltransferase